MWGQLSFGEFYVGLVVFGKDQKLGKLMTVRVSAINTLCLLIIVIKNLPKSIHASI